MNGVWTDITAYVMLRDQVQITNMGRTDEAGSISPAQLTLTLNNRDGRFTPKNASGAYYPNITRNCQVRVSVNATSVTGVNYSGFRFFGEIASWPPGYNVSLDDVYVSVTASGIWRRISQATVNIGSCYWRYVQLMSGTASPAAYWSMEDGNASAAFVLCDGTGTNLAFTAGVPSFSADTASFGGSNALPQPNLARMAGNVSSAATPTNNIVRFALSVPAKGDSTGSTFSGGAEVCKILANGTIKRVDVTLAANQLQIRGYTSAAGGTAAFSGTVTTKVNGVPVLASVEITPSGSAINWALRIIKPGAGAALDQVTGSRAATSIAAVTQVQLNGQGRLTDTTTGQLGVWYTVQALASDAAAIGGQAGETATARFTRICGESNIASTVVGSGGATMGPQADGTMSSILQSIEDTDGGLLFESRDGFGLGYRTLASMQNQAATVTFSHGSGVLGEPLSPTYDDSLIRNAVTVTNWDGYSSLAQLTSGAMSTAAPPNGVGGGYTTSKTINASTHAQVTAIATQTLWQGTADDVRYPTVTVNFQRAAAAPFFASVPGLRLGDHLQITSMPAFLGGGTTKQLIWGYTERMGGEIPGWTIEYNTIPEAPFESGFNPGVYSAVQAPAGTVASGSGVGSTVAASQLPVTLPPVSLPARTTGGITTYTSATTPYDWTFTVTGTPADVTYFGCTPDQAFAISPGDTFTHSAGLGGPFTVTTVETPPGANATVHFTPDASSVMSSGTVQGGKDGDLWINTAADNKLEQWEAGAWTPYLFGAGALTGTLSGLKIVGAFFLAGAGGGSAWQGATPSVPGYFLYWDDGVANPEVIAAISAATGSDQWANTWQGGVTLVGLDVLLNVLSVQNPGGDVLAAIDYLGNFTGQTVSAADEVYAGGTALSESLGSLADGLVNRAWTPTNALGGTPWPSTPVGTTDTAILELDQTLTAGRAYKIVVTSVNFIPSASGTQLVHNLRATTDGSTPTNTSTVLAFKVVNTTSASLNQQAPSIEYLTPSLASDTLYRMLLCAHVQSGTFQYQDFVEIRIEDIGPWTTDTNSQNGLRLGTGTSGGSGSGQLYTKTYYATGSHSYYGATATSGGGANSKRSDNSSIYQGARSGQINVSGDQFSFINFDYTTIAAALSGATIRSIKLRLNNIDSWYSSGSTIVLGWTTSVTYGATHAPGAPESMAQYSYTTKKGQTLTKTLPAAFGTAFQSGGATALMLGTSASLTTSTDLHNYCGFFGYSATNHVNCPALIIQYAK